MEMYVNLDVDDLERGDRFYREVLGLRVGRRFGASGVELLGASAPIYLLVKAAGTPAAPTTAQRRDYGRHWTPVHLDFVVEDVEVASARAVAAGARLDQPISDHKWGRLAVLADPFGHGFCFVQPVGRGYDEIAK